MSVAVGTMSWSMSTRSTTRSSYGRRPGGACGTYSRQTAHGSRSTPTRRRVGVTRALCHVTTSISAPSLRVMVPERLTPVLRELAPLAVRFREAGHRLYSSVAPFVTCSSDPGATTSTSTSPPTLGRRRSSGVSKAGRMRSGPRGRSSARSVPRFATPRAGSSGSTRSRRSEPRPTPTSRASHTWCSPMRSRPICRVATSP